MTRKGKENKAVHHATSSFGFCVMCPSTYSDHFYLIDFKVISVIPKVKGLKMYGMHGDD